MGIEDLRKYYRNFRPLIFKDAVNGSSVSRPAIASNREAPTIDTLRNAVVSTSGDTTVKTSVTPATGVPKARKNILIQAPIAPTAEAPKHARASAPKNESPQRVLRSHSNKATPPTVAPGPRRSSRVVEPIKLQERAKGEKKRKGKSASDGWNSWMLAFVCIEQSHPSTE